MQIPVERPARFAPFDEYDHHVLYGALVAFAADILGDAEREEIDRGALPSAAGTFLRASLLAHELAPLVGEEQFDVESLEVMAQVIADGDAPLAAKHAAEAVAE
jgi:hypothetical protein